MPQANRRRRARALRAFKKEVGTGIAFDHVPSTDQLRLAGTAGIPAIGFEFISDGGRVERVAYRTCRGWHVETGLKN